MRRLGIWRKIAERGKGEHERRREPRKQEEQREQGEQVDKKRLIKGVESGRELTMKPRRFNTQVLAEAREKSDHVARGSPLLGDVCPSILVR